MKIVFIPGFGEEISIFEKIAPAVTGEKIFIDNWTLLYDTPERGLNVSVYAEYLVDKFLITNEDVIIGHSMGGWIALQIKQLTGCRVVQLSSWTNGRKVITIPLSRPVTYWLAKKGWAFNDMCLSVLVFLYYRNKPSKDIFTKIFKRIQFGDKVIVAKQLMIVYNPPSKPITVFPDLRIHAKSDDIIAPPDEAFVEVPGDHFALYTFPEAVLETVNEFLK